MVRPVIPFDHKTRARDASDADLAARLQGEAMPGSGAPDERVAVWDALGVLPAEAFATPVTPRTPPLMWGALAASLAAGLIFYAATRPDIYESGIGQIREIRLQDGTHVTLNTGSRLEVRVSDHRREARLTRGEAFFEVTHKTNRLPFDVYAGPAHIHVTGTRFNVERGAVGVDVDLLQGHVAVSSRTDQAGAQLAPGQAIRVDAQGKLGAVHAARATYIDDWRQGRVSFTATPLAEAVAEMNRYSRKPISIDDPALNILRIDGEFNAGDTTAFANALSAVYGVKAHNEDGKLKLSRS